jgi:hypothetical protein
MYKNTLKAKKMNVNQDVVIKYVNSLPAEDVGNLLKVQVARQAEQEAAGQLEPAKPEQVIVSGSVDLSGNDLSGNSL